MSVSLTDLLTTEQDIVKAINAAGQNLLDINGAQSASAISAATLVMSGQGRLVNVSVTTAGAVGVIYDASNTGTTTNPIYVIPNTVGVVQVNIPVNNGIVVAPGASQVVTVSYS